jgi:hypothetical protein
VTDADHGGVERAAAVGSAVMSSFQVIAPGSLTSSAPARVPACQNPTVAPVGSVTTATRPYGPASEGGITTVAPSASAVLVVASTSSTAR